MERNADDDLPILTDVVELRPSTGAMKRNAYGAPDGTSVRRLQLRSYIGLRPASIASFSAATARMA